MSPPGRPKGEYRSAQHEGTPVNRWPVDIQPLALLRELGEAQQKIVRGIERIAALGEAELAIATTPKEEIWREDMVRLYRYLPDSQAAPSDARRSSC